MRLDNFLINQRLQKVIGERISLFQIRPALRTLMLLSNYSSDAGLAEGVATLCYMRVTHPLEADGALKPVSLHELGYPLIFVPYFNFRLFIQLLFLSFPVPSFLFLVPVLLRIL